MQQANGSISTPSKKQLIAIKPKVKRRVTVLRCAEIRWFHRKQNEKWIPLNGYDSTVLEVAYRRKQELELDDATRVCLDTLPPSIIVLDGNYKADEDLKQASAIYWLDDTIEIRRGSWFYADTNQPLASDFADAIEKHHLSSFRDNVIPDGPVFSESESSKKPVLTSMKWGDEEVRWNSVIDTHIASQKGSKIIRFITRAKGSEPLRRGYTEETNPADGRPQYSDLILVVHGIGQKGYQNLIAKNTAQIRESVSALMEKHYGEEKRRPAFLPVEWRSSLTLDNGQTDVVTLPRMENARSTLNSVGMDLMYYQSPLYRSEIVNGVISSLNSVYRTFVENNPSFTGPISILAHSLGSVITYDILTSWSPFLLYDQFVANAIEDNIKNCSGGQERQLLEDFRNSRKRMMELGGFMEQILVSHEERLKFKVKYFFCLGSPLAIYVLMRGADYRSVLPKPAQAERIFNIFHPYDPIAYRLEPLFHENYKHIRPVRLSSYSSAIKDYATATYECHKSFLRKQKNNNKKKQKSEKGAKGVNGDDDANTDEKPQSDGGEEHFMDEDSDSDASVTTDSASKRGTPRSTTPRSGTPPTVAASPLPAITNGMLSVPKVSGHLTKSAEDEIEDAEQAAEDLGNEASDNEEKHANKLAAENELKLFGDAATLIEQIPAERRIAQRIDFQVQPERMRVGYWSMLHAHFSYWSNKDLAAFLLNAIYPPRPAIEPNSEH